MYNSWSTPFFPFPMYKEKKNLEKKARRGGYWTSKLWLHFSHLHFPQISAAQNRQTRTFQLSSFGCSRSARPSASAFSALVFFLTHNTPHHTAFYSWGFVSLFLCFLLSSPSPASSFIPRSSFFSRHTHTFPRLFFLLLSHSLSPSSYRTPSSYEGPKGDRI